MDQAGEAATENFRFLVNQLICQTIAISCGRENAAAVDGAAIAAYRCLARFHSPHLRAARKAVPDP